MIYSNDVDFLLDVDNTLLDNDCVQNDLMQHLAREFGAAERDRYLAIFETLRQELRYADYPGALQRYRLGALDVQILADYPPADLTITGIAELPEFDFHGGFRSAGVN